METPGRPKSFPVAWQDDDIDIDVDLLERPAPPAHLSPEEAEQWTGIVQRMPPGWFSEINTHLLESLCCLSASLRHTERDLRHCDRVNKPGEYQRLSVQRRDELKLVTALSTKLKLTPSSRTTRHFAGRAVRDVPTRVPWKS